LEAHLCRSNLRIIFPKLVKLTLEEFMSVGNSREVRYITLLISENQTLNLMLYHVAKY